MSDCRGFTKCKLSLVWSSRLLGKIKTPSRGITSFLTLSDPEQSPASLNVPPNQLTPAQTLQVLRSTPEPPRGSGLPGCDA